MRFTVSSGLGIGCLLLMCAAGCAKDKYSDRDRTNPAYYEGTGVAVTDNTAVSAIGKNPEVTPPIYNKGSDAAGGLIESAISLAAYPDYYKPSTIGGNCVIRTEGSFATVPCRHVHIGLIDSAGSLLGRTETNDSGLFAFYVKKNKTYRLRILDGKVRLDEGDDHPLSMGANVTLHVQLPKKE